MLMVVKMKVVMIVTPWYSWPRPCHRGVPRPHQHVAWHHTVAHGHHGHAGRLSRVSCKHLSTWEHLRHQMLRGNHLMRRQAAKQAFVADTTLFFFVPFFFLLLLLLMIFRRLMSRKVPLRRQGGLSRVPQTLPNLLCFMVTGSCECHNWFVLLLFFRSYVFQWRLQRDGHFICWQVAFGAFPSFLLLRPEAVCML
jgi:hypothetical protein